MCEVCEKGFGGLVEMEQNALAEYGWYAHFVPEGEHLNAHTHFVRENFNHDDFQIVLNLPPHVLMPILHRIVDRVKTGEQFIEGVDYEDIIGGGLKVRFISAREDGREVLRVIFPTANGKLDPDDMDGPYAELYASQYARA